MTAEEKIKKLEKYIEEEINRYKKLFTEDLKSNNKIDQAMDREATRVLTKVKMILEEDKPKKEDKEVTHFKAVFEDNEDNEEEDNWLTDYHKD